MYAILYNRITGWVSVALGFIGLFGGTGDYIQMSPAEWTISFTLGWLAMSGARVKNKKNQVALCASVTVLYVCWVATATNQAMSVTSQATPLEWILRFLIAVWGVYCCGQEFMQWRRSLSHS